jgi:hypothetical protein
VTVGPAVWDLVNFVEQYQLLAGGPTPLASVETIEDAYILGMSARLGKRFNALEARAAIPAARCLAILASWLPRIGRWFDSGSGELADWGEVNGLGPAELAASGFDSLERLRMAIRQAFVRFHQAYRAL